MLSGIKTGKRKRTACAATAGGRPDGPSSNSRLASSLASDVPAAPEPALAAARAASSTGNKSAADELRASLLSGSKPTINPARRAEQPNISNLESRGRISNDILSKQEDTIVINAPGTADKTNNDLRYNSKGKLSRSQQNSLREKTDADMSISEMLAQERETTTSMDEIYARNIAKMGKSYKKYSNLTHNSKSGADEDDYLQETTLLSDRLYRNAPSNSIAPSLQEAKQKSRAIAQHSAYDKWKSRSWWWMESPSFDKKHLIALGDKVSLILVPSKYALVEGHCYIVPLSYSESFVGLDEEVWYEVSRFQNSLSQLFGKDKKGVIYLETASHASKSGTVSGLQCKMEVIPVSLKTIDDAPFYFKSSLAEMAQEWGTHQKPIVLKDSKTLKNAIPKGFPYFYCGWDNNQGYVQLIEGEDDGLGGSGQGKRNNGGYKDFGLDTVAGMMGLDPYRMRKRFGGSKEEFEKEKCGILRFCERWKEVDWTIELDG